MKQCLKTYFTNFYFFMSLLLPRFDFYFHVFILRFVFLLCCFLFICVCVCVCVCVWKELLLKDEECERLSKVRDQLGQELEELTASLFQVGPPASSPSLRLLSFLLPASCFLFLFLLWRRPDRNI